MAQLEHSPTLPTRQPIPLTPTARRLASLNMPFVDASTDDTVAIEIQHAARFDEPRLSRQNLLFDHVSRAVYLLTFSLIFFDSTHSRSLSHKSIRCECTVNRYQVYFIHSARANRPRRTIITLAWPCPTFATTILTTSDDHEPRR